MAHRTPPPLDSVRALRKSVGWLRVGAVGVVLASLPGRLEFVLPLAVAVLGWGVFKALRRARDGAWFLAAGGLTVVGACSLALAFADMWSDPLWLLARTLFPLGLALLAGAFTLWLGQLRTEPADRRLGLALVAACALRVPYAAFLWIWMEDLGLAWVLVEGIASAAVQLGLLGVWTRQWMRLRVPAALDDAGFAFRQLGLERVETDTGFQASGALGGRAVHVEAHTFPLPGAVTVRMAVDGLGGLQVRRRDGPGGTPLGDPVLDPMLIVEGGDHGLVLLAGLHNELLQLLHGHPGSEISRGCIALALTPDDLAGDSHRALRMHLARLDTLAQALESRVH